MKFCPVHSSCLSCPGWSSVPVESRSLKDLSRRCESGHSRRSSVGPKAPRSALCIFPSVRASVIRMLIYCCSEVLWKEGSGLLPVQKQEFSSKDNVFLSSPNSSEHVPGNRDQRNGTASNYKEEIATRECPYHGLPT